jgi:CRISPR-associated protein Cmr2
MKQYLFIFSIGPVQSFIAQARKTQDLYAGSRILSELTKKAIETVGREKIIFPFADMPDEDWAEIKSLPNRFVAKFQTDNPNELKGKGDEIEKAVRKAWCNLSKELITKYADESFFEEHCKSQIENHLDINWLFYPIGDDYALAYQEAESLLGSVKNVRVFKQQAEKGRKCSVDGERNVKFYRLTDDEKDINRLLDKKLFISKERKNEVKIYNDRNILPLNILSKGEGLSAVSFVKRCYQEKNKRNEFESTVEIALMQDENRVNQSEKLKNLVCCYKKLFNKNCLHQTCIELLTMGTISSIRLKDFEYQAQWNEDFDYEFFFEENLTEERFPNYFQRRLIKDVFYKLQPYFKSKYYAILTFDGDKMGEIMSGGFLEDKTILENYQKRTSELLSEFAKKYAILETPNDKTVKTLNDKTVETPNGKTVYAGGDDFLGFVNLDNLFSVMQSLRDKFNEYVNQPLKKEFRKELKDDFEFTFSAGVAIAHYKTPLSIVLKKAREMEKKAKDDTGRNAFGLAVLKHSGESHEACLKWFDDNAKSNIEKLENIVSELKENFSDTFIRSLDKETRLLTDNEGKLKYPEIINIEIERLLKRSLLEGKDKQKAVNLAKDIQSLLPIETTKLKKQTADVDSFIETLMISIFLKRKTSEKNEQPAYS